MVVYGVMSANGEVLPETIGPHPRSAMVNWLVVHAAQVIFNDFPDDFIRKLWLEKKEGNRIAVLEVEIVSEFDATSGELAWAT
jgi:hypothetical protein